MGVRGAGSGCEEVQMCESMMGRCKCIQVHKYPGAWMYRCTIAGVRGCAIAWVCSCADAQMRRCISVRMREGVSASSSAQGS